MAFSATATSLVKHMTKSMVKRMPLSTKSECEKEEVHREQQQQQLRELSRVTVPCRAAEVIVAAAPLDYSVLA
jgi:hypothetical protein